MSFNTQKFWQPYQGFHIKPASHHILARSWVCGAIPDDVLSYILFLNILNITQFTLWMTNIVIKWELQEKTVLKGIETFGRSQGTNQWQQRSHFSPEQGSSISLMFNVLCQPHTVMLLYSEKGQTSGDVGLMFNV